jgi:hypothetical protein
MAYWANTQNRRISRRAVLAIGGTAAGAAFLAACGGSNEPKQTGDKSSLVLKPQDETKTAKRGAFSKLATRWNLARWIRTCSRITFT